MSWLEWIHQVCVAKRRANVLSEYVAALLPPSSTVLDVGCGDGQIAWLVGQRRPDVQIRGVDVLVREKTTIPVTAFDGQCLPFDDGSFDVVTIVDVLHHADDPERLILEASRVARRAVVIKDHLREGWLADTTLRFMDRVGNCRHGVALPHNYWPRDLWQRAFRRHGLHVDYWSERMGLYPWPASWIFDRSLHFVARVIPAGSGRVA